MESLETIYLICAALGATVMVCQFALTLIGLGGHHDFGGGDHDLSHDVGHDAAHHEAGHGHESSWFAGVLTFRTIVAALTFFGLGGLTTSAGNWPPLITVLAALACGVAAMFLVAWIMQSLAKLQAEGNVRIDRAVGKTGTVYLTVPGQKAGAGKVTLNLQNRTVEYQAVTSLGELPTGAKVVVVAVVSPDTVEVAPAN